MLSSVNYFLLGSFSILFLYFFTQYILHRTEKYNVYFSLGCMVSIVRIIVSNILPYYEINRNEFFSILYIVHYFSFLWGPLFYVYLADSLFESEANKKVNNIFLMIVILVSLFIILAPLDFYASFSFYDYIVTGMLVYASYIFTRAWINKRKYANFLCIGNYIMCLGITFDVLLGQGVLVSPIGEINGYTYYIYLYIYTVILAKNSKDVHKKALQTELSFLHAQIQPHFLFNTINIITTYCRVNPDKARELLLELSTYLRGKFEYGKDNMYTSLKDELELIRSYLNIEKVRFKDRLEIEYDIDENIDIMVPCLIFQPLVENSVKHGLLSRKQGGKVTIVVKREKSKVLLSVIDNGKGIDKKRLPDILMGNEKGIGLSNTSKRLKRHYNTDVKVESHTGIGTKITITIPIKGGKNAKVYNNR